MIRALAFAATLVTLAIGSAEAATQRLYQCDDLAARAELTALNSKVYQGDDGWFFRDSDLNSFYMYSPSTMRFLTRLGDALAAHGITLALMPLPPKSILEPAHAAAATQDGDVLFDPAFALSAYTALVADLRANNLATADVLAEVQAATGLPDGDTYFARDIHWRPRLAMASARAVATLLTAIDPTLAGDKTFTTRDSGEAMNESNTNAIFNQLCAVTIPGETLDVYTTEQADQSADSFLGDDDTPPAIAVVGTSFTDEDKPFNFSGFLREAMSTDVATYSMSGGGVDTALYKWAYDGDAASSGARALVWEIPYPERLEPIAPAMERTILPAIAGSCAGTPDELMSAPFSLDARGSATIALDAALAVSGDGYFVAAALSDASPRNFALTFQYRDGRQDVLPIVRPERVPTVASIFGELSAGVPAALDSITLTNASTQPVSGTLSLCKYPDGMWRTADASQGKASP